MYCAGPCSGLSVWLHSVRIKAKNMHQKHASVWRALTARYKLKMRNIKTLTTFMIIGKKLYSIASKINSFNSLHFDWSTTTLGFNTPRFDHNLYNLWPLWLLSWLRHVTIRNHLFFVSFYFFIFCTDYWRKL